MCSLSKQTLLSIGHKTEKCRKSVISISFSRILFSLTICALICCIHSEELQNNRNRARVNERLSNNFDESTHSRPNWWQKKLDKKPTLFVNDEPIGTGVPTWKEIDIYGSEVRKGRSYAYRADSSSNRFVASILVIIIMNIFSFIATLY